MSASETKTKKVTFGTGLPRGACATFTHDGQLWFAYPKDKIQAVSVAMDRALGTISTLNEGLVDWINRHLEDAARVVRLMDRVTSFKQLALEKAQAWTM